MATRDDYVKQPIEARLARLARAADELAAAIRGRDDAVLSRRPEPKAWSAKEIVCHLRDIEELCVLRYHAMLAMPEPRMFVDRKSTRLNSSHLVISYAVFCLKNKKMY